MNSTMNSTSDSPITDTTNTSTNTCAVNGITSRLDDLEGSLPRIPAAALSFGRASTRRTVDIATSVYEEVSSRFDTVGSKVGTAARTTAGQARSAAGRSIETIKRNTAEATGQAKAQTSAVVETIENETAGLLDDAAASVDPKTINPASLADLTRDELYERAQVADIDGRSTMSKAELVAALRAS